MLWPTFMHHRKLLGPLCTAAWQTVRERHRTRSLPGANRASYRLSVIATPAAAVAAGADILVVGRPITGAPDPVAAARAIVAEIAGA